MILLLFAAPLSAETNWYRVAANTTLVVDWLQTHEIAKNNNYYETNKILGKHPSTGDVNRYFMSSILLTNIIGELLPKYSDYFYIAVAVVETKIILNNYVIGIRIRL
jgi:hypothetical protein